MSDNLRPDENLDPNQDRSDLSEPENDAREADAAAKAALGDTYAQASDGGPEHVSAEEPNLDEEDADEETKPAPAQLERLQKILARAGIASRRHAEELITQGRVQVNGKVVTELGTKADAARDHIRVDGKLLQGSERLRYFMLNKPKGYVTTVSDPEGRPTVMEFFGKMRERLYPVGRLDYMSEGLLLVTNDGELANKLTRAASGVEKTYLVKVSGQPTEEDLDRLREGVTIDRDKPGSGRVPTAPAQIRRFRPGKTGSGTRSGENPWYEVVLIEGRNRELRKMFEEIGHHVEKIRRIGYGPLELDLEPGNLRELEPEEVEDLRKAAEGKLRKPKRLRSHDRKPERAAAERPAGKPRWNQRDAEHGAHREDRRQRRGESRPRGRFEESRSESRPPRPPRRDQPAAGYGPDRNQAPQDRRRSRFESSDRGGKPAFAERGRGRFRDDRQGGKRYGSSAGKPFRSRPERQDRDQERHRPEQTEGERRQFPAKRTFQGRERFSSQDRPREKRGGFGEQRPSGRKREEGSHFEGAAPQRRGGKNFRDRSEQPNFAEGRRSEGRGRKSFGERSGSGPRPQGFRSRNSGQRDSGAKPGSVRSGGGRRAGSRPDRKPSGKRRPE